MGFKHWFLIIVGAECSRFDCCSCMFIFPTRCAACSHICFSSSLALSNWWWGSTLHLLHRSRTSDDWWVTVTMATGITHAYCTHTACMHKLKGDLCAFSDIKGGSSSSSGHTGHCVPPACLPGHTETWDINSTDNYCIPTILNTPLCTHSMAWAAANLVAFYSKHASLEWLTCHTNIFCSTTVSSFSATWLAADRK